MGSLFPVAVLANSRRYIYMEKRFLYLVGKKLAGEAGKSELDELDRLMKQDKELEQVYTSLFASKALLTNDDLLNAEQAYAAHFVKMQLNKQFETNASDENSSPVKVVALPRRKYRIAMWIAAASMLVVAGVYGIYNSLDTKKQHQQQPVAHMASSQNEIATKKGSKTNVRLPDGTQVWLNSDSKITYAENFQGSTREVQLTGEAFFDVVRDTTRPFIIHTPAISIKVLGTAFNVRSYPDEENTETSLVRGTIEVTLNNQADKKIILKPRDKLSVANIADKLPVAVPGNDAGDNIPVMTLAKMKYLPQDTAHSAEILWIDNKLAFDNEPLEKVASKISRWFNKDVVIKSVALKSLRFTAIFENESLEEVMEALQLTNNILNYSINNSTVIIDLKN